MILLKYLYRICLSAVLIFIFSLLSLFVIVKVQKTRQLLISTAQDYFSDRHGIHFTLSDFQIGFFPISVQLDSLYVPDQKHEVILSLNKLSLECKPLDLIKINQLNLPKISIDGAKVNLVLTHNKFNFDYIINEFSNTKEKKPEPKKVTKEFKIYCEKLSLIDINFNYSDKDRGNTIQTVADTLTISEIEASLVSQQYAALSLGAKNILVEQKSSNTKEEEVEEKKESNITILPRIKLTDIKLEAIAYLNISLDRSDTLLSKVDYFHLENGSYDMNKNSFEGRKVYTEKPVFLLKKEGLKDNLKNIDTSESVGKEQFKLSDFNWNIKLDSLTLKDGTIEVKEGPSEDTVKAFNPKDLDIKMLNLDINHVAIHPMQYKIRLDNCNFKEKKGLKLNSFKFDLAINDQFLKLDSLTLDFNNSKLNHQSYLSYHNLDHVFSSDLNVWKKNLDTLDFQLTSSQFLLGDVSFFVDTNKIQAMDSLHHKLFSLGVNISANSDSISLNSIKINSEQDVRVVVQSRINFPDRVELSKIRGWVNLDSTKIKKVFYKNFLSSNVLEKYSLPKLILLDAEVSMDDVIYASLNTMTEFGNIELELLYDSLKNMKSQVNLQNLVIGKILKKESLGNLGLKIGYSGTGVPTKENSKYSITCKLDSLHYNGYKYENINLISSGASDSLNFLLNSKDPNSVFYLNGKTKNIFSNPSIYVLGEINHLNMNRLKLSNDTLSLKTNFVLSGKGISLDNLESNFRIPTFTLSNNYKKTLDFRNFDLELKFKSDSAKLNINSSFLQAELSANNSLNKCVKAVEGMIDHYFSIYQKETPVSYEKLDIVSKACFKPSPFVHFGFISQLDSISDIGFKADIKGQTYFSDIELKVEHIGKKTNYLDSLVIAIKSNRDKINYEIQSQGLYLEDSLKIGNTGVKGDIMHNVLSYNSFINDKENVNRFLVSGKVLSDGAKKKITLDGKQILNNTNWYAKAGNYVEIDSAKISFNNFGFMNDSSSIFINTSKLAQGEIVDELKITNVDLSKLSDINNNGKWIIGGKLNAYLSNTMNHHYYGDVFLSDFGLFTHELANVNLQFNPGALPSSIEGYLDMGGPIGQIGVAFDLSEEFMGLKFDIKKTKLKSLYPFLKKELNSLSGDIHGKLDISVSKNYSDAEGKLHVDNFKINPKLLNNEFHNDSSYIDIKKSNFSFHNFSLFDSSKNKATIIGFVNLKEPNKPIFDLNFKMDKFVLMDKERNSEDDFYGKVVISNDTNIKGPLSKLIIGTGLEILDETNFFYENSNNILSEVGNGDGVILFTNSKEEELDKNSFDAFLPNNTNFELSANVSIGKGARFNLELDPATESKALVQGEAEVAVDYKSDGELLMNGSYKLENESFYGMKIYKVVARKFNAKEGSEIMWTGNPFNPSLNLTAVYRVRTSAYSLMQLESNLNAEELKAYKKSQLFDVNIIIKGTLSKPDLSFEILYPEAVGNIATGEINEALSRLNANENELNKQAFSLIFIQSFVSENNLDFNAGTSLLDNLSSVLSNQLNKISSKYLKGVDLSVNVNTYSESNEEGEQRTNANVGLSFKQSLFKNRLIVKLGGNVTVNNSNTSAQSSKDFVGDVELEYLLTEDGKYVLKGYRKADDGKIFSPTVVKTGMSFVFKKIFKLKE